MSNSVIGIELDGSRATIVEVTEGFAVTTRSVVGESALDALNLALVGVKPKVPVRVALVSPGTNMRPIDVTSAALTRPGFEAAAYSAIPVTPEGTIAAGLFFIDAADLASDALGSGVAVVAPEVPVLEAYKYLGTRPSEVVAPVLTLEGFDGVHLAVRWANADVTLVREGRTVSYRQLRVGGLSSLEDVLGAGRVDNLLDPTSAPDLAAEAELRNYLEVLAAEVRQTLDHWSRGGDELGGEVLIFGAGSSVPDLDAALEGVGLTRGRSEAMTKLLTYIPVQDRPQAVGAFLAGRTYATHLPQSVFPNPEAAARRQRAQRSAKQARRLAIAAAVAVGLLAVFLGPVAAGKANVAAAENELLDAEARLAGVQAERDDLDLLSGREDAYESQAQDDPRWSSLLASIYNSAAPGQIVISDLQLESSGSDIDVNLTGEASTSDYVVLTSWMTRLQDDLQAEDLVPGDFSQEATDQGASSSFELSFTVPAELVVDDSRTLTTDTEDN